MHLLWYKRWSSRHKMRFLHVIDCPLSMNQCLKNELYYTTQKACLSPAEVTVITNMKL